MEPIKLKLTRTGVHAIAATFERGGVEVSESEATQHGFMIPPGFDAMQIIFGVRAMIQHSNEQLKTQSKPGIFLNPGRN
jgi:hypothetical protein